MMRFTLIEVYQPELIGRRGKAKLNAHIKEAWRTAGKYWHDHYVAERFTKKHGIKAGYKLRRGEEPGLSPKEFLRSYTGTKWKKYHHKDPLRFSGEVKDLVVGRGANIYPTKTGFDVRYPQARKLNFRNRYSEINMVEEFQRPLQSEVAKIAQVFDEDVKRRIAADNSIEVKRI